MEKIYIGLDQSSRKTGFGVLNTKGELMEQGVVSIQGDTPIKRGYKLIKWFQENLVNKNTDKEIIIGLEDIKGSSINYLTTVTLSKILGMFEYYLYANNFKYQVIAPGTWRSKAEIKGRGREEQKANAIKKVKEKYKIDAKEDAAEALLIAEYIYKNNGWG